MKNLKNFLGLLFFSVYDGFNHKKNYSELNFSIPKFNKENFATNKYRTLYNLKIIFFYFTKFLIFPIGLILKLLNYRIVLVNTHSVGSCIEELEAVIKYNLLNKKFKLIFFCPKFFTDNEILIKTLFEKEVILLFNPLWTILISPLSFYSFISLSPYTSLIFKEKIIFPKQYFNAKKNKVNFSYKDFSHFRIFKKLLKYEAINKKFDYKKNFILHEKTFQSYKKTNNINNKICIIHIRNEKNFKLRNICIKNYFPVFDLLIKNDYKIILYYNDEIPQRYNDLIIHFKTLNKKDKFYQLLLIYNCDLYIGNYSGPFHIIDLFDNDTIVLNTVVFNHFIRKKNFINVPKKYFDNKSKNFLKVDEIFKRNVECVWDEKILSDLNITALELEDEEILEIIKFYLKNKKDFFKLDKFSFYQEIPNNKNLAINYVPKLKFLNDIFEK